MKAIFRRMAPEEKEAFYWNCNVTMMQREDIEGNNNSEEDGVKVDANNTIEMKYFFVKIWIGLQNQPLSVL